MSVDHFLDSALSGDLPTVTRFVESGVVDVNAACRHGFTALMKACIEGHVDVALYLADHPKCLLNAQNNFGFTALFCAAHYDRVPIVQHLLRKPPIDVNVPDTDHALTALHCAASRRYWECVRLLLQHPKIDVTLLNAQGMAAFDMNLLDAVTTGDTTELSRVLEFGIVDINRRFEGGRTAAHIATAHGFLECVNLLLKHPQVEVQLVDADGKTPADLARDNGYAELEARLVEFATTPEKRFLDAVTNQDTAEVCRLVEKDLVDINVRFFPGRTALHMACHYGWTATVESLTRYSHMIDMNARDDQHRYTPLHWACRHGHLEVLKLLMDHRDTDMQARTPADETAFDVAHKHKHNALCQYLKDNGGTQPYPQRGSQDPTLQFLAAARTGQLDELEFLFNRNAILDLKVHYVNGQTALHLASRYGHYNIVQFLAQRTYLRRQLALVDRNGRTALHEACRWRRNYRIVAYLLHRMTRDEIFMEDNHGRTAHEIATLCGNVQVAELFRTVEAPLPSSPASSEVVSMNSNSDRDEELDKLQRQCDALQSQYITLQARLQLVDDRQGEIVSMDQYKHLELEHNALQARLRGLEKTVWLMQGEIGILVAGIVMAGTVALVLQTNQGWFM